MELAALPVYCMPVPKKESSCASKCTRKTASTPCKKPAKDNEMANCCVNCPLCYVTTVASALMPGKTSGIVKRQYPRYQSNYLFTYYATSWKPPDVG